MPRGGREGRGLEGRSGTLLMGFPVRSISSDTRSGEAASAGLKLSRPGPITALTDGVSDVQPVDGLRRIPSRVLAYPRGAETTLRCGKGLPVV